MTTQLLVHKTEFNRTAPGDPSLIRRRIASVLPYLIAVLCVTASLLVREILNLRFGMNIIAGTFFPSVLVAALLGGLPTGLFATVLSTVLLWSVLTPPYFSFFPIGYPESSDLMVFVAINLLVTGLASNYRRIRLRAEADKRHLEFTLRESTHRVKNMLSVIQGISRQIAKRTHDIQEFQEAFYERLTSLALSHDLLVKRKWASVDIRDLITAQVNSFNSPAHITVEGSAILLKPTATEQLGLAIYELASNSIKYGAWKQGGRVSISWRVLKDSTLEFVWQETEAPYKPNNGRTGFGQMVLTTAVPKTLRGVACWADTPDGITWRLLIHQSHYINGNLVVLRPAP
jgi:two-component sensor histidine kinase